MPHKHNQPKGGCPYDLTGGKLIPLLLLPVVVLTTVAFVGRGTNENTSAFIYRTTLHALKPIPQNGITRNGNHYR